MKNRNRFEIITDILSVLSKNDNQTVTGVSDTNELKPGLVVSYLELLESGEYISDGHADNDAQYSITEKGEKLLILLEKGSGWN